MAFLHQGIKLVGVKVMEHHVALLSCTPSRTL